MNTDSIYDSSAASHDVKAGEIILLDVYNTNYTKRNEYKQNKTLV